MVCVHISMHIHIYMCTFVHIFMIYACMYDIHVCDMHVCVGSVPMYGMCVSVICVSVHRCEYMQLRKEKMKLFVYRGLPLRFSL